MKITDQKFRTSAHPISTHWRLLVLGVLLSGSTQAKPAVQDVTLQLQAAIEKGIKVAPSDKLHIQSDAAEVPGVNLNAMVLDRMKVKEQITPETTDLFGETIDLNTGALSLQQVDVSIPGNFDLPVELRRVFKGSSYAHQSNLTFGDWQLGVPSYSTSTLFDNNRFTGPWGEGRICSGGLNPGILGLGPSTLLAPGDYWSGETLDIPGGANEKVLTGPNTDPTTIKYIKNWRLSCLTLPGVAYEGIKATSPKGISYEFTVPKLIPAAPLAKLNGVGAFESVAKYHAFLMVSRISDRFGNYVDYQYDSEHHLTKVSASDGRLIEITYEQNPFGKSRIKTVQANGQQWQYQYKNAQFPQGSDSLERVTRPDNSSWQFDLGAINRNSGSATYRQEYYSMYYDPSMDRARYWLSRIEEIQCMDPVAHQPWQGSVTHPTGARLDLDFKWVLFGRTEVPKVRTSNEFEVHANDLCFSNNALVKKQLSQAGLTPMVWQYSYSQNKGSWRGQVAPALSGLLAVPSGYAAGDLRSTKVQAPDGSTTVHLFSRRWDHTDGKEVATEFYDTNGTTPLRRTERKYTTKETGADAEMRSMTGPELGWEFASDNAAVHENYVLQSQETVIEYVNGVASDTYVNQFSDFNEYGVPQQLKESNSFSSKTRYTKSSFWHDLTHWRLNLPTTKQLSADGYSYTTVDETTYYPITSTYKAAPYQQFSFGQLLSTNESYHSDGSLKLQNFNIANRWIELSQYKRGKPQQIKIPKRYSSTCSNPALCFELAKLTINDDGSVASAVNFNQVQTDYRYDEMGRLTLIDPADPKWQDTTISYTKDLTGSSSLTQAISRGSYRKEVTLDGLLQPMLTKEWDFDDAEKTARYQRFVFNAYGKPTFSSQLADTATASEGSQSTYDGLQRLIAQTNTAQGDIQIAMLATNGTKVTNGRGFSTSTYFEAYGAAETQRALKIQQPEQATTDISYNLFGNPTSIVQGGKTERRLYNGQQQLCLLQRPELGIKAMQYNTLGQLTRYAEGLTGNADSCSAYTNQPQYWVELGYDNQGAQQSISYTDGTPTLTYQRDAQGNVLQVNNSETLWEYGYNSLNLPEWERLTTNGKTFVIDQGYSSYGYLQSLLYVDELNVQYNRNALGQATKVSDGVREFANDAEYFPNGQLKKFSYGNGIKFSQQLDQDLRPSVRTWQQSWSKLLGQSYLYDEASNITSLTDHMDPTKSKTMQYDGLDRLSAVTENAGNTSFTYDVVGNLKSKISPQQSMTYLYDDNTNLLQAIAGSSYQFSYDQRGNVIHNGKRPFSFNLANQLKTSNGIQYFYDGYNRKVRQQKGGLSSYSLFDVAGRLLYRLDANATRLFSVYLDKQLVAEVTATGPVEPVRAPTLALNIVENQPPASTCSPKKICPPPTGVVHRYGWVSSAASQCTGGITEKRYGVQQSYRPLTGVNSSGNQITSGGEGFTYTLALTCVGNGGSVTKQHTMGLSMSIAPGKKF